MRTLGRLLKWTAIAVIFAEWYARVGREFVFGEDDGSYGIPVGETIRTWVPLVPGAPEPTDVPRPLAKDGEEIGLIHAVRLDEEAVDLAGHPVSQYEAYVEVAREKVGFPINVALAEIEQLTRQAFA